MTGTWKFRPHRGWLADAMKESVTVTDREGLMRHLRAIHPEFGPPFDEAKIVVAPYGSDERVHWMHLHIITDGSGVIGFADCPPDTSGSPAFGASSLPSSQTEADVSP